MVAVCAAGVLSKSSAELDTDSDTDDDEGKAQLVVESCVHGRGAVCMCVCRHFAAAALCIVVLNTYVLVPTPVTGKLNGADLDAYRRRRAGRKQHLVVTSTVALPGSRIV